MSLPNTTSEYRADLKQRPDLSSFEVRKRLSPGAIGAFINIMEAWGVKTEKARILIGNVSNGTYYNYRKNPKTVLNQDQLLRISLLVGIFKALNILHNEELADAWVLQPNTNRLFKGRAPLDVMIREGLPAMFAVRRLVDARRGCLA